MRGLKSSLLAIAICLPAHAAPWPATHMGPGSIMDQGVLNEPGLVAPASTGDTTYSGLNTNQYQFNISVGGLDPTWLFPNLNGAGNHSTAALAGSVVTPSGSYSGTYTWPDYGVSGTALTYNVAKNAVAHFGYAGIGIAGAGAEAFNGVITNCELSKTSCAAGGGYNWANLVGSEMDFNLNSLTSGTPTGGLTGFGAILNATAATMANVSASVFSAGVASTGRWTNVITSGNGVSTNAFSFGAQSATGPANSQPGYWTSIGADGTNHVAVEFLDSNGLWHLPPMISAITPDSQYQAQDGTDDAPSIGRADALASSVNGTVVFLARQYNWKSAVTKTGSVSWQCVRSQQPKTNGTGGTWFMISATTFNPLTISGAGAQGTRIDGCAWSDLQPTPAFPAAGSVGTYTPTNYPPTISVMNTNGDVFITNQLWSGVSKGVYADQSSRMWFTGWRGQFITYGAEIHRSADVNRMYDWQIWPYWADSKDVEKYTTANFQAIRLFRSDSPFIDKIFCIACNAALDLENETLSGLTGPPTKIHIGQISADQSQYTVINNATGSNFTADLIDYDGQDLTIAAVTALSGGAPFYNTAAMAGADISKIWAQGAAAGFVNIANNTATGCSNLTAGSAHLDNVGFANTTGYLLTALPCDGTTSYNSVQMATVPTISYASGSPGAFTTGAGGKLSWPTFVNQP